MRIFMHFHNLCPSDYYRAILPCKFCTEELKQEGIELLPPDVKVPDDADVYIFHRLCNFTKAVDLEGLKEKGKKIVWELDDDIWNIPTWNPCKSAINEQRREYLNLTRDLADEIWVSSSHLAYAAVAKPDKTLILPNLVDSGLYPAQAPRRSATGRVRILWAGSSSHHADLAEVEEALHLLLKACPEVEVMFWGYLPDTFVKWKREPGFDIAFPTPITDYGDRVIYKPSVSIADYVPELNKLHPDIAIAPLANDFFNLSKSHIKFVEMGMSHAAFFANAYGPYERLTKYKCPKLKDTRDWFNGLKELVKDKYRRFELQTLARKAAEIQTWQNENRKGLWLSAFRGLKHL